MEFFTEHHWWSEEWGSFTEIVVGVSRASQRGPEDHPRVERCSHGGTHSDVSKRVVSKDVTGIT